MQKNETPYSEIPVCPESITKLPESSGLWFDRHSVATAERAETIGELMKLIRTMAARVLTPQQMVSESFDDSPQNGVTLCKNHHWLMDAGIIAPGPANGSDYGDLRWHVRKGLDAEIEGQREVLQLTGKTVILPRDARLRPKREAVDRRMAMLTEAI
ncbi:MAG: HNH endonuclease [Kiritimatiellia bacterium]